MKINSEEARGLFDANNYLVFRNYATPPATSLFYKAYEKNTPYELNKPYEKKEHFIDSYGKNLGPMMSLPEYFFEDENVNNFYNECSDLYGVKTTLLLIEGRAVGSPTSRHCDASDVIHWQCMGKSEWTFYDNPTEGVETKIILNAGDIMWFKKDKDHSVVNLEDKFSIIFMASDALRNFLIKQFAAAGKEFI